MRLLTQQRIAAASAVQTSEPAIELLEEEPLPRALGYWPLGDPLSPTRGGKVVFGHGGAGGSLGLADATHGFAFGLTKNRMVESGFLTLPTMPLVFTAGALYQRNMTETVTKFRRSAPNLNRALTGS